MQKLMILTFVLSLVFAGSVIASPSEKNSFTQSQNTNSFPIEDYQSKTGVTEQGGTTCWICTKYVYGDGYKTCVSGKWSTVCPVAY